MLKIIIKNLLKLDNYLYRAISALANKKEGIHPKHRLIKYHDFFINNISPNDTVLDIGCGNGALAYDIAKKTKRVLGIDFSKENIFLAKQRYQADNVDYVYGDILTYELDKKYDVVVLSNVLEHIEDRITLLKTIKKITNKIIIRVPMMDREWITLYKKEIGVEWRLDNTHFTEYTLDSFKKELSEAGLTIDQHTVQFGEIWAITKVNN